MLRPTFPVAEVDRIRDERLNDILQAKAEPRRRVEETLVNTIYQPSLAVPPARRRHPRHRRTADSGGAPSCLGARP